jgi:hypothetical protein
MAFPPDDPEQHRRRQRNRALIGWLGGVVVIALIVVASVAGAGSDKHEERVEVPYGETMTSAQYAAIEEGEDENDVLEALDASGRPESQTKEYVLVLFPPHEDGAECTYWEFSDELQIFARLCFEDGELTQKLSENVHSGIEELENAVTA